MCTVFLGILQTRLLAHLLHTLKAESKLCMQYGKFIYFGGHKPTTKSFPASLETCGRQEVPEGWHPASDRRGHGALSLEIMLLPFPLPASNMRAVASVRYPIPYCATTGGWRIGPPRGGGGRGGGWFSCEISLLIGMCWGARDQHYCKKRLSTGCCDHWSLKAGFIYAHPGCIAPYVIYA